MFSAVFVLVGGVRSHSHLGRDALIALYNATDGANWTDNTNWLGEAGTECTWYGVTWPFDQSIVSTLDLKSNGLSGSIPPSLSNLTNRTSLILDFNDLSAPIPPEIGTLSLLRRLNLRGNRLSGSIPALSFFISFGSAKPFSLSRLSVA